MVKDNLIKIENKVLYMQIDDGLLNKLEKLSALKISEQKRKEVLKQLSEIVEFVDILNNIDLSKDQAMASVANGATPMRKDEPIGSHVIDDILKHAPLTQSHFFVVPKIIE